MKAPHSTYCRPAAYRLFCSQLDAIETTNGMLRAAIAISMHELKDVRPRAVEHRIGMLANRVKNRVQGGSQDALIAHLHQLLFDEECFRGNQDDYYDSRNSYPSLVLERKRGIPIALAMVYKCVANRLGLDVHGVNAPGHFLVRIKLEGAWTFVDPFFGGDILSRTEAIQRIQRLIGRDLPELATEIEDADVAENSLDPRFRIASHRDWLARMIRNLQGVFERRGSEKDIMAMRELAKLL